MARKVQMRIRVVDRASGPLGRAEKRMRDLQFAVQERRMRALQFAATLRGAHDDGEMLAWMEQRGYATVTPDDTVTLTEAGIDRADEIIAGDPGLFR